MKIRSATLVIVSCLGSTLLAQSQSSTVASMSFQQAVSRTGEFQHKYAEIQKKYIPTRQRIKVLQDEISSLENSSQNNSTESQSGNRAADLQELRAKRIELKSLGEDAQKHFEQDVREAFDAVAQKIAKLIDSYALEHHYRTILNRDEKTSHIAYGRQETLDAIYADSRSDITNAIVEAYDSAPNLNSFHSLQIICSRRVIPVTHRCDAP